VGHKDCTWIKVAVELNAISLCQSWHSSPAKQGITLSGPTWHFMFWPYKSYWSPAINNILVSSHTIYLSPAIYEISVSSHYRHLELGPVYVLLPILKFTVESDTNERIHIYWHSSLLETLQRYAGKECDHMLTMAIDQDTMKSARPNDTWTDPISISITAASIPL